VREVRSDKLAQIVLIDSRALLENKRGVQRFAPAFIREPDDCNLLHGWDETYVRRKK
jgi:hypothetical protein